MTRKGSETHEKGLGIVSSKKSTEQWSAIDHLHECLILSEIDLSQSDRSYHSRVKYEMLQKPLKASLAVLS